MKRRRKKSRPLLVATLGLAAVGYLGCEPEAIGNPKRPPECIGTDCDLSVVRYPDIGNPKQPPDLGVDASERD